MADFKDYYKTLGVSENATQDEISKAYKKLALKYHPDRHVSDTEEEKKAAEEQFKKISEAYSVIGDEEKRKEYDMGGTSGFGGFNPFEGFGFADFFNGMRRNHTEKGENTYATVVITLEEALKGGKKEIDIRKKVKCSACNGHGSADGKDTTCPHCHGTGMVTETIQRGNSIWQNSHPCNHCHGTGKIITNPCKKCNGTGFETVTTKEWIEIPKGVANNMAMRLAGLGSMPASGKGIPGDLEVTFIVANDPYFERPDPINLVHYEEVSIGEALEGCTKEVRTVDGKTIKVKLPECTHDGQAFYYDGYGMPDVNNPSRRGKYAVVIRYKYPTSLTRSQKKALEEFK